MSFGNNQDWSSLFLRKNSSMDSVVQSKMTIPLGLQNIHYNLLNGCNSVILALSSRNRRPPQFFLFFWVSSPFVGEVDTLCRGKKWFMPSRGNFLETSSQAFLKLMLKSLPVSTWRRSHRSVNWTVSLLAFCSCFLYFCLDSQEKM